MLSLIFAHCNCHKPARSWAGWIHCLRRNPQNRRLGFQQGVFKRCSGRVARATRHVAGGLKLGLHRRRRHCHQVDAQIALGGRGASSPEGLNFGWKNAISFVKQLNDYGLSHKVLRNCNLFNLCPLASSPGLLAYALRFDYATALCEIAHDDA